MSERKLTIANSTDGLTKGTKCSASIVDKSKNRKDFLDKLQIMLTNQPEIQVQVRNESNKEQNFEEFANYVK